MDHALEINKTTEDDGKDTQNENQTNRFAVLRGSAGLIQRLPGSAGLWFKWYFWVIYTTAMSEIKVKQDKNEEWSHFWL